MSYYSIDATLIGKDSTTLEHRRGYFESDCNLRFFIFDCTANDSTYGVADVPGDIDVLFNYQTHLCKFLSIGPLIKESKFWRSAITPLGNPELYASSYVTQTGTDGQRVLKINVSRLKENSKRKVQKRTALLGTLYLDASTYLPLRYDGSVKNLNFKNLPTELDFHIIYHYKYGFAEVTQLYLSGHNKKYRFRFGLRYRETLDKNVKYVYRTSYYAGIATPTPKEEIKRCKDYQKSIKKSIARKYRKKQKTFTKKYNELFKNCKRVYIDR